MPLISIVIANFNYGRFLEEAIRSVVTQDGFNECELIVCDAGSTDNSVEIIKKYTGKISWWCSEKDQGQSDAFNKGFAHSRGKIGCWVNADDILLPGALRAVLTAMKRNPAAEWFTGGMAFCDNGMRVRQLRIGTSLPPLVRPTVLSMTIIGGPSSFFSIERMKKIGGFNLSLHYTMDTDLWMRLFIDGVRYVHINRYFWAFRLHEGSKTSPILISPEGADSGQLKECARLDENSSATRFGMRMGSVILRLWKLMNGSIVRSVIDTRRFAGRSIYDVR